MRHNKDKRSSFGLKPGPRKALLRNLVSSLVEHERIKTTLPRAWEIRRLVEKALTIGQKNTMGSTRLLLSRYPNKKTVFKIVKELAPRFQDRKGGSTRLIRVGKRKGDHAEMAYVEFVDYKISDKKDPEKTESKKDVDPQTSLLKKKQYLNREQSRKRIQKIQKKSRRINRP